MKFRTMAVAGCAAVLAAGLTTGTASAEEELPCSTPVHTSPPVRIVAPGWVYEYRVLWCVEGGVITKIKQRITHEEDGNRCAWVGNAEESVTPVQDGSGGLNAFNMAEFSCKNADGTDGSFNPWAVITVWPNGDSRPHRKGIGDEILD